MKYHFAKVAMKNDGPAEGCWYFVARNEQQLREHWEKYAGADIRAGVQQLAEGLSGSFRGHWTSNFASLVAMKCEIQNQPYFIQAVLLENELFQNRLHDLKKYGEVWLAHNLTVFGYTPQLHKIVEEEESDNLIYPDEKRPTIADVRFLRWGDGEHWYAKIGIIDIVDEMVIRNGIPTERPNKPHLITLIVTIQRNESKSKSDRRNCGRA